MPNQSPLAVANEFLKRQGRYGMPSQMWLQKLVYIAQGWNLAVNGEPLVADDVEAWDGGPVFRRIWNHIRDYGTDHGQGRQLVDPATGSPFVAELTGAEASVIEHVWNKYHTFSGRDLSLMTHRPGTPWTMAYMSAGRDAVIPKSQIRLHYLELAKAGRG